MHWGMPILAELVADELVDQLPSAVTTPYLKFEGDDETFPVFNGLTGDLLFRMPSPGGRRFSRQKLRKILVQTLDVGWGKKLATLSSSDSGPVQLGFEDGTTFDADFVVGADGPNSTLRELLVGREAAQSSSSGLTWTTGITKYNDAAKVQTIVDMHPVAALTFSPAGPAGYGGEFFFFLIKQNAGQLAGSCAADPSRSPRRARPRRPVDLDHLLGQDLQGRADQPPRPGGHRLHPRDDQGPLEAVPGRHRLDARRQLVLRRRDALLAARQVGQPRRARYAARRRRTPDAPVYVSPYPKTPGRGEAGSRRIDADATAQTADRAFSTP